MMPQPSTTLTPEIVVFLGSIALLSLLFVGYLIKLQVRDWRRILRKRERLRMRRA